MSAVVQIFFGSFNYDFRISVSHPKTLRPINGSYRDISTRPVPSAVSSMALALHFQVFRRLNPATVWQPGYLSCAWSCSLSLPYQFSDSKSQCRLSPIHPEALIEVGRPQGTPLQICYLAMNEQAFSLKTDGFPDLLTSSPMYACFFQKTTDNFPCEKHDSTTKKVLEKTTLSSRTPKRFLLTHRMAGVRIPMVRTINDVVAI